MGFIGWQSGKENGKIYIVILILKNIGIGQEKGWRGEERHSNKHCDD